MSWSACSSKGSSGSTGDLDGGKPDARIYDNDAGDGGKGDRICEGSRCADGQKCEAASGEAACVPSCEKVTCPAGEGCKIAGRYGVCVSACEPACSSGQRCESGACVSVTCDELDCGATGACVAAPAGGNECKDNTCEDDVSCSESESCRGGICVGDECSPGARHCDDRRVLECAPNGGSELVRMTCTRAAYTESSCVDSAGSAHCSCRDDWDCPEFSHCTLGRCEGTGRTPHCFLRPTEFASLLPEDEPGFPWGGNDSDGYTSLAANGALKHGSPTRSRDAAGHPFPRHSQVTSTPIVANLDDDNGDGLVNELDLPELIFTSFCDTNYFNHGVLRALHGGGANAGKELFARCGDKLWSQGDAVVDGSGVQLPAASCDCNAGDLEPTGAPAVGDLDGDGFPEVVVTGHASSAGQNEEKNTRVVILNRRGDVISDNAVGDLAGGNPAVTLANLDASGLAEIVVGARVLVLEEQAGKLRVARVFSGDKSQGLNNGQGAISCVADLDDDGRQEVVAGATAYKLPRPPAGACPSDTSGLSAEEQAYCSGKLQVMWSTNNVDGFCAVADVLAKRDTAQDPEPPASAALDGEPEVVLISGGRLRIYNGRTGLERVNRELTNGAGGPPNIDDFDGDGFPEIGTAGSTAYVLHDLQPATAQCPAWPAPLDGLPTADAAANPNPARTAPGQSCSRDEDCGDAAQFACGKQGSCVCLHNGWTSTTQDASSNVTGSSVFDFNGDGAAEVVYNDECFFRIYDGSTGSVYQRLDSQSPTRIEYPVVADVDNDGNAEIVFSAGNARSQGCASTGQTVLPNGLRVIGDPSDRWVSARRIWNEHAYHVTNVLESGAVPTEEVPSWLSYANRRYNTYRSNLPPFGNVAPDLTVLAVGVTSPGVTCGQALDREIRIVARVANQGDLRVGQNVLVRFYDQDDKQLGEGPLGVGLEPGAEVRITLDYTAASNDAIPTKVKVVVDASEEERECAEDNNALTKTIETRDKSAELSVSIEQIDDQCPVRRVRVRVENTGMARVEEVPVELYAGQPSAGGTLLVGHSVGPIDAKGHAEVEADVDTVGRNVTVFVVVNPASTVAECDESDNAAQTQIDCNFSPN